MKPRRPLPALLAMALASSLLLACAAGPQPMPDPGVTQPLPVKPEASLLLPPRRLPGPPRSGKPEDLEANHRQVARVYHQLASQLCGLLIYLQAPTDGCPPPTEPRRSLTDDE